MMTIKREDRSAKLKETGHACSGYNLRDCLFHSNGNVVDIKDVKCMKMYVYDRGRDKKTAYLHYVDGVEIWDYNPALWKGWKLGYRMDESSGF